VALLASLPACGKKGDPQPPLPRAPQAVAGLAVAQRGRQLEVTYVAPRATVGRVPLQALEVEVLRADREGDFEQVARAQSRKAAPGEAVRETVPLPPPGTQVRLAARARAGGHVSALTPIVTLTAQTPPAAPSDLKAELKPKGVALTWTEPPGGIPPPIVKPSPSPSQAPPPSPPASPLASPSPSPTPTSPPASSSPSAPAGSPPAATPAPDTAAASPMPPPSPSAPPTPAPSPTPPPPPSSGYWVYRRDPGGAYEAPLARAPLQVAAFTDETVAPGQSFCYVARLVAATEPVIESEPTSEVCLAVKDVAAPAAPTGVAALVRDGAVELSWSPSSEPDLAGYRVYRAREGATPERVGEVGAGESAFRDATLPAGAPHFYTVTAVDAAGNESPHSAPAEGALP
jgi:hypothetical protein